MKNSTAIHSQYKAFTLMELLVVITIIAVLMGLLFPVIAAVRNSANKAQASNDVVNIVTAVKAYYTDYGKYPLLDPQTYGAQVSAADTVYGDPNGLYPNYELFNVLRCPAGWTDNQNASGPQNPRQIVYLDAKTVQNTARPRSGISTSATNVISPNGDTIKQGDWVDPWGNEYAIFVDATYDNSISSNGGGTLWFYYGSGNPGDGVVTTGVGACSLGKDGTWGTNGNGTWPGSDDVVSW